MWAALKADMNEFVSTVKAETTGKLNVLDQGLDDVNDSHNDASGALIDLGTGMVIDDSAAGDDENGNSMIHDSMLTNTTLPSKEEMLEYLHSCEAVFRDPLEEEEEEFMSSFPLDEKTQGISKLLEENPETLRATFEELTSEVEYADFWKRYYCRLHEERLADTYGNYYEETVGPSALSSVTNFLGGAVARLVEEGGEGEGSTTKSTLGFLTGGGRPPFVLNTADSGDLDEEYEGEEQQQGSVDEEEDFGWGEDSDDEDDDDDDGGEIVEFKDTEKEELKEKLQQATEERNQLQKTIEMQAAEIKELKVNGTGNEEKGEASTPAAAADVALKEELDALKMEVFERDSELAGLKLKMEDNKMEHQHQREEISEQMQAHLQEKDQAIASLQVQLDAALQEKNNAASSNEEEDALLAQSKKENAELRTSLNDFVQRWGQQETKNTEAAQALEESQAENEKLHEEVKLLKDQLVAMQKDLETATTAAASKGDDLHGKLMQAKQEISTLQQKATSAKSQLDGLQEENQKLKGDLEGSESKVQGLTQNLDQAKSLLQQAASSAAAEKETIAQENQALKAELEASKTLLQQTQAELMETKTHVSAGSQSTGIKVGTSEEQETAEVVQQNGDNEDIDGDDWGDDW